MFSTLKDKLSNNPMDPMLEMLDDSALSAAQLAQITTSTGSALLGVETEGRVIIIGLIYTLVVHRNFSYM